MDVDTSTNVHDRLTPQKHKTKAGSAASSTQWPHQRRQDHREAADSQGRPSPAAEDRLRGAWANHQDKLVAISDDFQTDFFEFNSSPVELLWIQWQSARNSAYFKINEN